MKEQKKNQQNAQDENIFQKIGGFAGEVAGKISVKKDRLVALAGNAMQTLNFGAEEAKASTQTAANNQAKKTARKSAAKVKKTAPASTVAPAKKTVTAKKAATKKNAVASKIAVAGKTSTVAVKSAVKKTAKKK